MVLRESNREDFDRFIPSLEAVGAFDPRPIGPKFSLLEGQYTMTYGDIVLLDFSTQDLVGIIDGAYFGRYWEHVDEGCGFIPMPIRAANEDEIPKTIKGHSVSSWFVDEAQNLFGRDRVNVGTPNFEQVVAFRKEVFEIARQNTAEDESFEDLIDNCVMLEDYLLTGNLAEVDQD